MKKLIYLIIPALMLVVSSFSGCEQTVDDADIFTVEGTIVSILFCQGNGYLISVENIQNFGETGSFQYGGGDALINYQNAIVVPLFDPSAIEGGNRIMPPICAGDKLEFECRIKTNADDYLFYSDVVCTANFIPPSAPRYIITKILNYQKQ